MPASIGNSLVFEGALIDRMIDFSGIVASVQLSGARC